MNMVIMCQVHYLRTEKEGEHLEIVPKCTPIDTTKAYPINNYRMSMINERFLHMLSAGTKMLLHNMEEMENEEVEFYVWQGNLT